MAHKKRTHIQKYQAVVLSLSAATYQVTRTSLALDMGYKNGDPLKVVIEQLISEGLVETTEGELFNRPIVWLWMNRANRKIALKQIGYDE